MMRLSDFTNDNVAFVFSPKGENITFTVTAWKDSKCPGLNIYINNQLTAVVEVCIDLDLEDKMPEVNVRAYKNFTNNDPETVKWPLSLDSGWTKLETKPFCTPFDQHYDRNGQTFKIIRPLNDDEIDKDETGPMFLIRFDSDGFETEACPEEIFKGYHF